MQETAAGLASDLRRDPSRKRRRTEPSSTILAHGIPDEGITEQRLEQVAWEVAVRAGCSMPNGVHFAHRAQRLLYGVIEFPHKAQVNTVPQDAQCFFGAPRTPPRCSWSTLQAFWRWMVSTWLLRTMVGGMQAAVNGNAY